MNSICDLISKINIEFKDKIFLIENNQNLSYGELNNEMNKCFNYMLESKHPFYSFNFSIIAPNSLNYLIYLFAFLKKGGTAVNLNPNLSEIEIKERLNLGEVSLLITTQSIYAKLEPMIGDTGINTVIIIDENAFEFKEPIIHHRNPSRKFRHKTESDIAFLQFTGGTTGVTKAAKIKHENILQNIAQLNQHFGKYRDLNNLHVLIAFPFYHIFSIVFNVLFFMSNGGTCYLYQDLRNTDLILKLLKENHINFTVAVNTWYKKLMQHPDFQSLDTTKIATSLAGGEYVPLSTKNQWQQLTGKPLYSAYGLTETSSLAIISPIDQSNIDDSIGVAIPDTQAALSDENDTFIASDNIAGELVLKGPQVTSGYYNNLDESDKAFRDGWFRTGDIAERIDGKFYKIVDRKKDMISVSGNKVYPNEVESVLSKLKDILDVGVVGMKSEKSGEEVAACVVLRENSELSDEKIIEFCKEFLSRYKIPKHIFRFSELPKTPIGKTFRKELREKINKNIES
jgi:long-chain acyl-CoA synthetase